MKYDPALAVVFDLLALAALWYWGLILILKAWLLKPLIPSFWFSGAWTAVVFFLWRITAHPGGEDSPGARLLKNADPKRRGLMWAACAILFCHLAWVLGPSLLPWVRNKDYVDNAKESLNSICVLEEKHKAATGAYTTDLRELSLLLGEPQRLENLLSPTLHIDSVKIDITTHSYRIEARAMDDDRTVVAHSGP